ncbi:class II glutamine amidotransferase [Sinosporangium siamense]|uniref:Class II glutamine amidotransferase n=2 Tax=Sinosporangium siamense TaxID=1367973 RepID=A0A919RK02_9ACTN|nr:class II glutamine amidotransferase [Sinosporangium siamense]
MVEGNTYMCRLFGLSSSPTRARAVFWLLEAPDSLREQAHRDPDGTGLGYFDADGTPHLHKAPLAAYADRRFAEEAKEVWSTTFIAHVRFASTGGLERRNTHPFEQDGRLFAHNGVVEGLDLLDAHLGADRSPVRGDTDSERVFALITREVRRHEGDIGAGIASAVRWIARSLPVYALNVVLTTPQELWALRYPDTHELFVLQRTPGDQGLDHAGTGGRMRVRSSDLSRAPAVVVASEKMDDDPGWRPLRSGELLHCAADLTVTRTLILPDPPAHRLTLADLHPAAAASQKAP